jgi:hypothetical protein
MTDSNLSDKITDSINIFFKKPEVFQKTEKIKFYIGTFFIFSSIIGITGILINYSNSNRINKINKNLSKIDSSIKDNVKINRSICIRTIENRISDFENKIFILLLDQQKTLNKIEKLLTEIQTLSILDIHKKQTISVSTSTSSINMNLLEQNVNTEKKEEEYEKKEEEYENNEDDELMNECYDVIPLNNLKKNTLINWF